MRLSVAVAVASLAIIGLANADGARASIRKSTNIPAQPLAAALQTLAKDRNFQVVYISEEVNSLQTQGAVGEFTPEEALKQLLKGTGMTYRYLDEKTITIMRMPAAGSGAGASSASAPDATRQVDAQRGDHKSLLGLVLLAQANGDQVGSTTPVEQQSTQPSEKASQLQEVIVTAQKRSENLMEVPSSLTALSAGALENQGVLNFNDYMTLVPSLNQFSEGAVGHGAIILRALNTGYYQFSNTVGYYIDDTPFSSTSPLGYGTFLILDPDLIDVDHLEILKGPQATLYGASTLGGLIKVVTKKPDPRESFSGQVRVDGSSIDGGGSGLGLAGMVNFAIVPDRLALRLSGFDRETPGYMTNVALGNKDRGESRKQGGRISLGWFPTDNLEIELSAFLQSLDVKGLTYEHSELTTLQPIYGPYTYSAAIEAHFHTTYEVYSATINYKFASGTLTSATSYARYSDHETEDYSLYYGPYFNSFAPVPVPPNYAQPLLFSPSLDKFTEELRFTTQRLDAFEGLGGLFYTDEKIGYTNYLYNTIPPSVEPVPGVLGNILSFSSPASYKEAAAFADLTYYFKDTLDLTLGGRYSHNKQDVVTYYSGFATIPSAIPNSSSDSDFTYLAALHWQPTADLSSYARIATSYRPGGPQGTPLPGYPPSFKPDSLTNYEVGLKGAWLEHRIRSNLAVYYMDWKDVQMTSNIGGFAVISNGAKATVKGVEFESQFLAITHLTVGLNLAYTNAKFDSISPDVTAVTGAVAGDTLPFTPTWAGSATADYIQPLGGGLAASCGLTYRYQGNKWSDYPGNPLNTGVVIPHYNTLDIRAGLNWSRYQLQARVANLFNEHGLDSVVDQRVEDNPPAYQAVIPPRTYALTFIANL
jgi:iron complex outermembrane recepter protein